MEPKKLLMIIMSVLLAFVVIISAFLGLIKFYPAALGLPEPAKDTTNIMNTNLAPQQASAGPAPVIPIAHLTQYQLDSLNIELMKRNLDSNERKAIIDNNRFLIDSINKINNMIAGLKDNFSKTADTLNKKAGVSKKLSDSLTTLYNLYLKANNEIAATKEKIKAQEKSIEKNIDSLSQKNFETFAKIYNGSSPKEVAKILEQIDEKDAAKILKMMQKKKASKVLDLMKPEVSAAILLLGAGN